LGHHQAIRYPTTQSGIETRRLDEPVKNEKKGVVPFGGIKYGMTKSMKNMWITLTTIRLNTVWQSKHPIGRFQRSTVIGKKACMKLVGQAILRTMISATLLSHKFFGAWNAPYLTELYNSIA
jgi:hypothetical protein